MKCRPDEINKNQSHRKGITGRAVDSTWKVMYLWKNDQMIWQCALLELGKDTKALLRGKMCCWGQRPDCPPGTFRKGAVDNTEQHFMQNYGEGLIQLPVCF
jgi:hypothetical protein